MRTNWKEKKGWAGSIQRVNPGKWSILTQLPQVIKTARMRSQWHGCPDLRFGFFVFLKTHCCLSCVSSLSLFLLLSFALKASYLRAARGLSRRCSASEHGEHPPSAFIAHFPPLRRAPCPPIPPSPPHTVLSHHPYSELQGPKPLPPPPLCPPHGSRAESRTIMGLEAQVQTVRFQPWTPIVGFFLLFFLITSRVKTGKKI